MLLELLLALILGICIGTITGLLPGIHINLISVILLSIPMFLTINPIYLAVLILSITLTHLFIDFIPTILLGAPEESTILSVLPGHELLLQGRGNEAIILSITGLLIGLILFLPFSILFLLFLKSTYSLFLPGIPFILIAILVFMLYLEKNKSNFFNAMIIMILSSLLGLAVLSFNLPIKEPLLPLLTGLFGSSSIILSLSQNKKIPIQQISKLSLVLRENKKEFFKPLLASIISSPLCSFIPGLGSNQASIISSYIFNNLNKKQFLILIGITNFLVTSLSFIVLFTINKSRTGSAAYISKLLPTLQISDLIIFIIIILISSIIAFILTLFLSKLFSRIINKINYNLLSILTLLFIILIIIIFSNYIGLAVFLISTFLGISCLLLNVNRTIMMSCLIFPTLIYYLI